MTRKEYVNFCQSKKVSELKRQTHNMPSVTDPAFAQTGRQMIENPLNINYRMQYSQGAPLDKENPLQMHEFDKMYGDKFKSMLEAKQHVESTKTKVRKAHDHYQQQQQQNES